MTSVPLVEGGSISSQLSVSLNSPAGFFAMSVDDVRSALAEPLRGGPAGGHQEAPEGDIGSAGATARHVSGVILTQT